MYNRFPLDNEEDEKQRVLDYWDWLKQQDIEDTSIKIDSVWHELKTSNDADWHELKTPNDADYEAKYMDHSIGHSWDKYSQYGRLFSLRDNNNIPVVTALLSHDNKFIHYKEYANARLSTKNMLALQKFAEDNNFGITPEKYAIDIFIKNGNNTSITYLTRDDQDKVFHINKEIFQGVVPFEKIIKLLDKLKGNQFNPLNFELPKLDNQKHEISCIATTFNEPTINKKLENIIDRNINSKTPSMTF